MFRSTPTCPSWLSAVPLACPAMLDFKNLQTPLSHGDVLVEPGPGALLLAAKKNRQSLANASVMIAGQTLAHWRSQTRKKIAGRDEIFIIVTGHQPDFIHPGVWAKHVVSARLAKALNGKVINLVVDSDVVKRSSLPIPVERQGHVSLSRVPYTNAGKDLSYEQMPKLSHEQLDMFESRLREALGPNYQQSQWPAFFIGARNTTGAKDWVDQAVAGRRAIEAGLGISVEDHRISEHWCTPLIADMLLNARKFAASYNRALATYRLENNVKGHARPIPDLVISDDQCEVALWAHTANTARRRLFASADADRVRLFADETEIASLPVTSLRNHKCSACKELAANLQQSGWELRPRALTLTLWARLLLADIFVHGIGGAKYDRITDNIMRDYYEIDAPAMACVSATLHLPLPVHQAESADPHQESLHPQASLHQLHRESRDWQHNPQLTLDGLPAAQDQLAARQTLVMKSQELRARSPKNRRSRRQVFDNLRQIKAQLQQYQPNRQAAIDARIAQMRQTTLENEIAKGREYFFGLFDDQTLHQLLSALPAEADFAV